MKSAKVGILLTLAALAAGYAVAKAEPTGAASLIQALKPETLNNWNAKLDGSPKAYQVDGLVITFTAQNDPSGYLQHILVAIGSTAKLARSDPAAVVLTIDDASHADVNFGVGKIDPIASGPQLVLTSYTGGAHCCVEIEVLEHDGTLWRQIDIPGGEQGGLEAFPHDIDGDGIAEFVVTDDRFAYAFDSFASSWMPPRVFGIRGGKRVELSNTGAYDALYRSDMKSARPVCMQGVNGACAGYLADAARLSQFKEAWKFVLTHYNPQQQWDYPKGCKQRPVHGSCLKGQEITYRSYPEALAYFLEKLGYINTDQLRDLFPQIR